MFLTIQKANLVEIQSIVADFGDISQVAKS